ncbi:hypothetical protein ACGFSB_27575 [Streptomyces sp. NPDC048441]|uniref:hypothetical protein n=1 Tax=Streptomyces sp. NPDC048441 TaxID=3365552 RepID=UPI0037118845
MRIRNKLAAAGLGAAIAFGALIVPAQAAPSAHDIAPRAAVQVSTNGDVAAAAKWRYTGSRYWYAIQCHSDAVNLTYTTGWPTQCRGPHTDGYYYLWAYH